MTLTQPFVRTAILSANVYVFLHQVRLSDVVKNDLTPCPAVPSLFRVRVVDEE